MFFGANQNEVASTEPFIKYTASNTMLRTYKGFDTTTTTWPVLPGGAIPCWSIRPNPGDLIAGVYDNALKAIAKSAPKGAVLSAYHEASLVQGMTAQLAVRIQIYIHTVIHSVTDTLPFGNITLSGEGIEWDAPGMDWYGVDVYDWNSDGKIDAHLNFWYGNHIKGKIPALRQDAPTIITENNSHIQSHRPAWFTNAYEWLASPPAGWGLLQFWNPSGKWSGPFVDNDAVTIKVLNEISAAAPSNGPLA